MSVFALSAAVGLKPLTADACCPLKLAAQTFAGNVKKGLQTGTVATQPRRRGLRF